MNDESNGDTDSQLLVRVRHDGVMDPSGTRNPEVQYVLISNQSKNGISRRAEPNRELGLGK